MPNNRPRWPREAIWFVLIFAICLFAIVAASAWRTAHALEHDDVLICVDQTALRDNVTPPARHRTLVMLGLQDAGLCAHYPRADLERVGVVSKITDTYKVGDRWERTVYAIVHAIAAGEDVYFMEAQP